MSEPAPLEKRAVVSAGSDLFGLAHVSMRTRLGEFVDIYMSAKIKIAQKLADKIAGENDVDKLMELRGKLNDVLFAQSDIEQIDAKLKAFIAVLQTNWSAFFELRDEWRAALMEEFPKRP